MIIAWRTAGTAPIPLIDAGALCWSGAQSNAACGSRCAGSATFGSPVRDAAFVLQPSAAFRTCGALSRFTSQFTTGGRAPCADRVSRSARGVLVKRLTQDRRDRTARAMCSHRVRATCAYPQILWITLCVTRRVHSVDKAITHLRTLSDRICISGSMRAARHHHCVRKR